MKRTVWIDSLILACLAFLLIKPLFQLEYMDNWPSIESTFISDARMLGDHLPHPGWQPLWYGGTRTDYVYPPALRYGTVLIAKAAGVSTARAYHLYTAILYCFGILAVYWLVWVGSASRMAALVASAGTALLSPSFLLLSPIRIDSGFWVPQRLHVLAAYGEGPHISALCILPAALAASFAGLRRRSTGMLALAGFLSALAVANNFYGATALAVFFPVLVWSVWVTGRDSGVWLRALAIPLVAYGLCAFWLTPSYVWITLLDLKWVSQPGNSNGLILGLVVVLLYAGISWIFGKGRPERAWPMFVLGVTLLFSVTVLGFYYFGLRIAGEAPRLIPELDLVLILAAIEVLRSFWSIGLLRVPAILVLLLAFSPSVRYLQHAWTPFPKAAPLESVYEYKITKWVHDNLPGQRVLPSGTVRFWFDAWFDNEQPDGGSMQGMLNQRIPDATWQILHGDRADLAILWMQALGTDAVVVPDKNALEHYKDYAFPEKFKGAAAALFDDGHGTVVYRIPRRSGMARVVDQEALKGLTEMHGGDDSATLTKYVSAVEDPAQPAAKLTWRSFEAASISAETKAGQSVLVQETWDPSWTAVENGRIVPIRVEPLMGFMLIDAGAGTHNIELRFETPFENRVGQVLFFLTLIGMAVLSWPRGAGARSVVTSGTGLLA